MASSSVSFPVTEEYAEGSKSFLVEVDDDFALLASAAPALLPLFVFLVLRMTTPTSEMRHLEEHPF